MLEDILLVSDGKSRIETLSFLNGRCPKGQIPSAGVIVGELKLKRKVRGVQGV
jgi:hypothetical protein